MLTRLLVVALLILLPVAFAAKTPWEKPVEQWNLDDCYHILRDSPWSPAKVVIESVYSQPHRDAQTGVVKEAPADPQNTGPISSVLLTASHELSATPVLWWSSKTIRLAQQRLRQLQAHTSGAPLQAENMTEHVLAIEGEDAQRVFQDAKEDLHDTVFLETDGGFTLDLASVKFVEATATEEARTEFHFPRQINEQQMISPEAERIVFHCRATAKTEKPNRINAISIRVDFKPSTMKLRGAPDL